MKCFHLNCWTLYFEPSQHFHRPTLYICVPEQLVKTKTLSKLIKVKSRASVNKLIPYNLDTTVSMIVFNPKLKLIFRFKTYNLNCIVINYYTIKSIWVFELVKTSFIFKKRHTWTVTACLNYKLFSKQKHLYSLFWEKHILSN